MLEYWTILVSWNLMSHIVLLLFSFLHIYRRGFDLSACLISMSSLKWDRSQPSKMFIARETMHKSWQYQISRHKIFQIFKHFEIWYPILICLYLGSQISYRKVFVLQTKLWIPPFQWIMSQPSRMFLVREIKQNLCCEFSEVFFAPPFNLA